jgi:hypothetical protein
MHSITVYLAVQVASYRNAELLLWCVQAIVMLIFCCGVFKLSYCRIAFVVCSSYRNAEILCWCVQAIVMLNCYCEFKLS